MDQSTQVADQNTDRLIQAAYEPDFLPADLKAKVEAKLIAESLALAQRRTMPAPAAAPTRWRRLAVIGGSIATCLLIGVAWWGLTRPVQQPRHDGPKLPVAFIKKPAEADAPPLPKVVPAKWTDDVRDGMIPRIRPDAPKLASLKEGETLATKAGQRRLVQLADGSRLYVNEKTEVEATGDRRVTLHKGQIYLEVAPIDGAPAFVVKAGSREMTATGTHFAVQSDPIASGLVVTQGKVAVKGIDKEVAAGQQLEPAKFHVSTAPRASHTLQWTRELMAAAESPLVPACAHAGGALLAVDPQGQEIKLALRQYLIDVHIEDGFARTTIDQTYFNATWERLEGTFYFPLPADASLSRLAMYVVDGNQCKLMEGGMAERKHAADVYETIRYQRRDPALLEWLDGSTFKMRVFPLEAKQEKRIILSYSQKLPTLYGATRYRFPGGHNLPIVRDWSFNARIRNGGNMTVWSPTHPDAQIAPGGDTLVQIFGKNMKPSDDVALEMKDNAAPVDRDLPRFASFLHDNHQYLMLRYRPTLPSLPERQRRDWIVLFEASAARDPLLAGTQVDILRHVLKNAEYDDTFTLLTVNSKVQIHNDKPQAARPNNVEAALKMLQDTHLVGALDLQQGLQAALKIAKDAKHPHLLHIGSGIPAMGQRDAGSLAKLLPESVRYVGVGVGKRWNRAFMKAAAERTGGLFTQINPDEAIAWRAFDLLATLNTPRLLNVQVFDGDGKTPLLLETSMIAQGEELCAIAHVETNRSALPGKVIVKGTIVSPRPGGEGTGVSGEAFVKEFPVQNTLSGAAYLPRAWAKLEIDRLLADDAAERKDMIIALSKAMYVMSPFTSLLVLETDADYERFKVDKGRKDHWAMYPAPPKIPLVYEPNGKAPVKEVKKIKKSEKPAVQEVLGTFANGPVVLSIQHLVEDVTQAHVGEVIIAGNAITKDRVIRHGLNGIQLGQILRYEDGDAIQFPPSATWKALVKPRKARYIVDEKEGPFLDVFGRPQRDPEPAEAIAEPAPVFRKFSADWGKLPPRDREPLLEKALDQLAPKKRQAIEDYFRNLGKQKTSNKDMEDIAFKMSKMEDRLELARGDRRLTKDSERLLRRRRLFYEVEDLAPETKRKVAATYERVMSVNSRISKGDDTAALKKQTDALKSFDQSIHSNEEFFLEIGHQAPLMFNRGPHSKALDGFLRYERPRLNYERSYFTDLMQYAPGLRTSQADILATLEAEADVELPTLGTSDASARKLIDKARSAGWQTLTVPADGPLPNYKIHHNGSGQFAYERMLVSGLREGVICDGTTLWQLYPEIGLAAKRPFSRHHQHLAASINPAFVPSADELARGHDLKVIDTSTVALVPLWSADLDKDEKYARVHLIFAKDGRLAERRIVEMPDGKTVARQLFQADGSIEWQDADGKQVAKEMRAIAPAAAPSLVPKADKLLAINYPIRTREHVERRTHKLGLSETHETQIEFFLADMLTNPRRLAAVKLGVILQKEKDRQLGFYTILNAAGIELRTQHVRYADGKEMEFDIEKDHPGSALAKFLAQCQREIAANDLGLIQNLPGPKDGFIQRLAQFRTLWLSWQRNTVADSPLERAKVIEFLHDTPSPLFAYAVIDAMQWHGRRALTDHMMDVAVKRFGPISDPLGLGYIFRYEQARIYWQAGKAADSAKLFKELHATTLKYGMLPPIDGSFRDVLQMPVAGDPMYIGFIRGTLDGLLEKKRHGLAFQLARQMNHLGDEALSEEILTAILAKAAAAERDGLTLACIDYLAERKSFAHADRLLAKALEDKKLAQHSELWRWRAEVTQSYGQTATSVECLEKALDLEYADLPELVNLESIRADYRTLLGHYQRIAEANASLQQQAPKAFLAKVIRTADRWRLLDADAAEPCMLAGKIFHTLGNRDLAWDYWTTPIDLHPAESKPWVDLGETLKTEGDLERADLAFGLAFEAEPTNPEILWKRAQTQVRMGQSDGARRLYRQIADGTWQERFAATVEQAKGLAEK